MAPTQTTPLAEETIDRITVAECATWRSTSFLDRNVVAFITGWVVVFALLLGLCPKGLPLGYRLLIILAAPALIYAGLLIALVFTKRKRHQSMRNEAIRRLTWYSSVLGEEATTSLVADRGLSGQLVHALRAWAWIYQRANSDTVSHAMRTAAKQKSFLVGCTIYDDATDRYARHIVHYRVADTIEPRLSEMLARDIVNSRGWRLVSKECNDSDWKVQRHLEQTTIENNTEINVEVLVAR